MPPADEDTLLDVFYAAYRLNGTSFVRQVSETITGAEHLDGHRDRLVTLLDQAVMAVENADDAGFILRFKDNDGEMREIEFAPGATTDEPVAPEPAKVKWRAPPASLPTSSPKCLRRKRPAKTHGKNKKRKR